MCDIIWDCRVSLSASLNCYVSVDPQIQRDIKDFVFFYEKNLVDNKWTNFWYIVTAYHLKLTRGGIYISSINGERSIVWQTTNLNRWFKPKFSTTSRLFYCSRNENLFSITRSQVYICLHLIVWFRSIIFECCYIIHKKFYLLKLIYFIGFRVTIILKR